MFGALWLYKRIKAVLDLKVDLIGVSFNGSITNPVINLQFSIFNNSEVTATVRNLSGNIFVNDDFPIGTVSTLINQDINAYSRTLITIPVTTYLPTVLSSVADMIKGKLSSVTFTGSINVDDHVLPLQITQPLS